MIREASLILEDSLRLIKLAKKEKMRANQTTSRREAKSRFEMKWIVMEMPCDLFINDKQIKSWSWSRRSNALVKWVRLWQMKCWREATQWCHRRLHQSWREEYTLIQGWRVFRFHFLEEIEGKEESHEEVSAKWLKTLEESSSFAPWSRVYGYSKLYSLEKKMRKEPFISQWKSRSSSRSSSGKRSPSLEIRYNLTNSSCNVLLLFFCTSTEASWSNCSLSQMSSIKNWFSCSFLILIQVWCSLAISH